MKKTFTKLLGRMLRITGLAIWVLLFSLTNLQAQYCVPSTQLDCTPPVLDEYISNVTVNGISNASDCSVYSDYSSTVTFNGIQGQDVPVTINITNFFSEDDIAIFIDWNNDFDFNDPDELVYQVGFSGPGMTNPQSGFFTANPSAAPGVYRMRIYLSYFQTAPDPCATTWFFGEAEDYSFQLNAATGCLPVSLGSVTVTDNIVGSATLNWSSPSGADFFFIRYKKTTDPVSVATWANPMDASSPTTLTGLETCATYEVQFKSVCGVDESDWSNSFTFNTPCYCTPTVAICDEYIANVIIGAIQNPTGCTTGGYSNYTNVVYNVSASTAEVITVSMGTFYTTDDLSIFVDWNNDFDFNDAGELIYSLADIGVQTINANVNIPAVPDGQYRMRVALYFNTGFNDPCANTTFGEYEDYTLEVGPPPPCIGVTNVAASNITLTSADITWTGPVTADSYNIRYKKTTEPTSVATWANPTNVSGTSFTITGLETCNTYEVEVQSVCPGGLTSSFSFTYTFNSPCYCTPTITNCDEYISNVIIGTNQNPTGCTAGGYNDYTAIQYNVSASTAEVINVEIGNLFSGDDISIFVDWNQDLDFNDPGEMIYSQADFPGTPVIANVNIPAVPDGNYRMRVRLYFNTGFEDPCASSAFGEIEDYTLVVGPPPSCIGASNLNMTNLTLTTADINWTASPTAVSYNVRYKTTLESTAVATWANPINTTSTSVTLSGLDTCKTYQVQVQAVCAGGDTSTYSFTLTFASACYCTANATICDEYISNVTIGSTSNPSGCTTGGYTNYSGSVFFEVEAGACAQVIVENGVNLYANDQCGVWIDWNGDLDFNDPGETIPVTGSPGTGPYLGQITVPGNQPVGSYRMRVRIMWIGALLPCGSTTYGEVEDYTINVVSGSACTGVGVVNFAGQTLNSITLDWVTGAASYNVRYKLTSEDDTASTWVNPINTTTVPFTLTGLDSCAQYEIQVQAVCAGGDVSAYSCSFFYGTLCCLDPLPLANYIEQESCGDDTNGGCNATPNSFEPVSCGMAIAGTSWWNGNTRDTDWFLLNLTQDQNVEISMTSAFLGQILLFNAAGCPVGTPLANIAATSQCETITIAGNYPAGNYWIVALPQFDFNETYPCGGGKNNYLLTIDCTDPLPPPVNDPCSGAIAVACGDTISGSTIYATPDPEAPFCGTTPQSNGVWYTLVGDGSFVTLSLCSGTDYDSKLNVYTGSCGSFTCVAGNDDFCGLQSQVTFQSVNGTTYYILVNGFTASNGNFTMSVTCEFPPAYDNVCGALELTYGVNGPFNTTLGSVETGEPAPPADGCQTTTGWCNSTISNTLWFTFTAPASGHVSVHSPGFDTQLAVWTAADCNAILNGGATLVAANDDDPNNVVNGGALFSSYIELKCLTPGATYYVQLDPYFSSGAQTPIILTDLGPLASSDFSGLDAAYCAGASAVTLTPVTPGGTFAGPGVTGSVFNPVAAGVGGPYTITYTLESCNVTSKEVIVEQITASAIATATSCGLNNGSVDLTAGGGAGLTYNWSNAATSEDLSGLASGTYNVTVTSAAGCSATTNATVSPSIGVTILSDITDETCGQANGAIDITAFGNGTLNYQWSNSSTNEDLFDLSANTYSLTVTDDNGCTASDVVIVTGTQAVVASGITTNVNCGVPGAINITMDSGTTPFTFNWSNGATTEDLNNITAGDYSLTVTDVNGCSTTYEGTIVGVGSQVDVTVTPAGPLASCHMAFNITLTANPIPNVQYTWIRGQFGQGYNIMQVGGTTYQPNTPGVRKYFVVATDTVTGCADTSNTVIVELSTFEKPVITVGNCVNQTIQLSTTNYGPGFTYTWYYAAEPITGATSNTYTATTYGGYRVFVKDSCGVEKFSEPVSLSVDCFKPTGIENIDANGNGINVYPNPNNGTFNVELFFEGAGFENANFEIFNIIGQRVMNKEITFVNGYVNVPVGLNDMLADGVYTVRVTLKGEEIIRKVVVNRN